MFPESKYDLIDLAVRAGPRTLNSLLYKKAAPPGLTMSWTGIEVYYTPGRISLVTVCM